jgi:mRNA interferase RelE/StbE
LKVEFRGSFGKDLRCVGDEKIKARVQERIETVERAQNLQEIKNLKKLRGGGQNYSMRVGDYRLGLILEGDTVVFVRFLHRREVYRYFP